MSVEEPHTAVLERIEKELQMLKNGTVDRLKLDELEKEILSLKEAGCCKQLHQTADRERFQYVYLRFQVRRPFHHCLQSLAKASG